MTPDTVPARPSEPAWVQHVMWWHVYPLGFVGAEVRPAAPVGGAPAWSTASTASTAWLDHVVDLGLNGLLLGPVFASSTHGYDTVDHFRIDPRLGDDADFDALVAAAHERGVRVLLDGVFNHVGREHPAFRALETTARRRRPPTCSPSTGPGGSRGEPVPVGLFEGHDILVALDHDSRSHRGPRGRRS